MVGDLEHKGVNAVVVVSAANDQGSSFRSVKHGGNQEVKHGALLTAQHDGKRRRKLGRGVDKDEIDNIRITSRSKKKK